MTSAPEHIIVECPVCGHCYEEWYRASINRWIENFSDEYIERNSTAICPRCNCKAKLGVLISDRTGQLHLQLQQARFRRKEDPPIYWVRVDRVAPTSRVNVMKVIRSVTNLDLGEVKCLIDNLPQTVMEEWDGEKAESLKKMLEDAGAQVTLKYF